MINNTKTVKWVICSGSDWYRPSYSSTRQIMDEFHREGYNILYVNPIPFKSVIVNSVNKKSALKKILNKFRTHLRIFKKQRERFYVFVPFYIPLFKPWADNLNERLIRTQLSLIKILLGIKNNQTILWIVGSFTLSGELQTKYYKKVYEAADLVSDFRTSDEQLKKSLRVKESYLSNKSDVVFACTDRIASKLSSFTEKPAELLYHGVDFDHFNKIQIPAKEIINIKKKGLPIAGYFGSLSDTANDLKVFEILAKNNFSVVMIGKALGDFSWLNKYANIHMLGPIDYNVLPSYGQSFDICFMSWHQHEWLENCYPIKTLEYLAMGKPVVSVPIPILKKLFPGIIYFASTPEEFLYQSQLALNEDSDAKRSERINAVREYDWTNRFEIIRSKLNLNGSEIYEFDKTLNSIHLSGKM